MGDYWIETIESSLEEAGILAQTHQIASIAADVEVAHDNYDMAHGYDVASANLSANKDAEIEGLKAELRVEREKEVCSECGGRGEITIQGPCHSATSQCGKCRGAGRR